MKNHFDKRWTQFQNPSGETKNTQRYIIEYDADKIYGEKAAEAMRETLNATFLDETFLKAFDVNTTFKQLRPVLLDLFPLCELHDLTDQQLKESVNGIQGLVSGFFNAVGLTGTSDVAIVVKLLKSLLLPKNGKYQPSTEVLTFEGIVNSANGTQLLTFQDEDGYPRFFNQELAKYFYKIMKELPNVKPETIKTAIAAKKIIEGDFFISQTFNKIYEMQRKNNKIEMSKTVGKKYARSKSWVVPKSAIERENRGENFKSGKPKFKIAESKYPAPIPAGELSAMLAELSSMDNTESEYASEDTSEFEEFASEEFASDSEEFASDDF